MEFLGKGKAFLKSKAFHKWLWLFVTEYDGEKKKVD